MKKLKKIVSLILLMGLFSEHAQATFTWSQLNPFTWDNNVTKITCAITGLLFTSVVAYKYLTYSNHVPDKEKLPIVYHPNYNIGFFGLEKLHPFDSAKYGKVADYLKTALKVTDNHFYKPRGEVPHDDLLKVHTQEYLHSLNNSYDIAQITEVPIGFIPNFLLQRYLLNPMRYATQGTIVAAQLALKKGVGINLGGGYHHAKAGSGGGFCVYADIPLAIKVLREQDPGLKVMYVDLDAHQGNGVASILEKEKDTNTYIFDCYNEYNFPRDEIAAKRINKTMNSNEIYCEKCNKSDRAIKTRGRRTENHNPQCAECNKTFLSNLEQSLLESLKDFKGIHNKNPDIMFYNAGTDCFEEDPLGLMKLTKESIINRDEMVFQKAKKRGIPICMTLSGGYTKKSAEIIGASLVNLYNKGLLKTN